MCIETKAKFALMLAWSALLLSTQSYGETRPKPSDADLAQSAINSFFKTTDRAFQMDRISEARDVYSGRAQVSPNEIAGATIIFSQGKNPAALERFLYANDFQLVSVQLKIPYGSNGVVRTLQLGAGQLMSIRGSDRQRLEAQISEKRKEYGAIANLVEGEEANDYAELARTEFKVFRADVVGRNKDFRKILMRDDVLGVFPDLSEQIVNAKRVFEEAASRGTFHR